MFNSWRRKVSVVGGYDPSTIEKANNPAIDTTKTTTDATKTDSTSNEKDKPVTESSVQATEKEKESVTFTSFTSQTQTDKPTVYQHAIVGSYGVHTASSPDSDNNPRGYFNLPTPTYKPVVHRPMLRLNLYVMGKLEYLLACTSNEIGGFMLSNSLDDPLGIVDLLLVKQRVGPASVEFEDDDIMNFNMDMFERGFGEPDQFARIWAHTHPVMSANPSATDERTFSSKFSDRSRRGGGFCPPWAGMFIRSRTGENYFRLIFNPENGPSVSVECPVVIDPKLPFKAYDKDAWKAEFEKMVSSAWSTTYTPSGYPGYGGYSNNSYNNIGFRGPSQPHHNSTPNWQSHYGFRKDEERKEENTANEKKEVPLSERSYFPSSVNIEDIEDLSADEKKEVILACPDVADLLEEAEHPTWQQSLRHTENSLEWFDELKYFDEDDKERSIYE